MKGLKRSIARLTRPMRKSVVSAFQPKLASAPDGRRRESEARLREIEEASAWLERRRSTIEPDLRREAEAIQRLFGVLAMPSQAAKGAARLSETCRRLDPERVQRAFSANKHGVAPALVRNNLVIVIRRLRDDDEFELALAYADILAVTGEDVQATRERMLVCMEAGQFVEAEQSCKHLLEGDQSSIVSSVSEWMLVRLARAPGDAAAMRLTLTLLRKSLIDRNSVGAVSSIASIISSLAAWAGRAEPAAGDVAVQDDAPSSAWASRQLERIEAGLREARKTGESGASFELTYIRLLGIRNGYAAAFDAMADYVERHPVTRGTAAIFGLVMDRYLRHRHSAGTRMDLVAPLLDVAVFAGYEPRIAQEEEAIWSSWPFAQNLTSATRAATLCAPQGGVPSSFRRDQRTRVLVVSSNWNFVSPLIESMEHTEASEFVFRTLDFQSLTFAEKSAKPEGLFFFSEVAAAQVWKAVRKAAPDAARLVDWADVIFVEWANQPAVFFSSVLPAHKRLIVRLHSYEAFANWHYFVNWARVDKALFVADHIRQLFLAQNRLGRVSGLQSGIVANRHDFSAPVAKRNPEGKRTLCMLGWATANKDPIFALQILKILRSDGDWRLQLVGGSWRETAADFEAEYRVRFNTLLADPALAGAIDILPHTDQPHAALSEVGYVLSCSHREGTHEAVVEGLSVGCVPIIRNWPMVARYGGARGQFADFEEFIVSTPEEAAEKIRATPWTLRRAADLHRRANAAYGIERTKAALKEALRLP